MEKTATTLAALRGLIAGRFPQAARTAGHELATGITALDEQAHGLPRAALTELVCTGPSTGSQLFLGQLLLRVRQHGGRVGLIDGADSFDPSSWPAEYLEHLTWVRCQASSDVIPVADLFARDANFELVVLDVRQATKAELRRIPATAWYRLQRAVEQADLALLVVTPLAVVPSAQLRIGLAGPHHLPDQGKERPALTVTLPVTLQRQRLAAAG